MKITMLCKCGLHISRETDVNVETDAMAIHQAMAWYFSHTCQFPPHGPNFKMLPPAKPR